MSQRPRGHSGEAGEGESQDDSPRQRARRQARVAGERSAKVARVLMELSEPAARDLELEPDLREAVERARSVRSNVARRREERRLAGVLRRADFEELERTLAELGGESATEELLEKRVEDWCDRLLAEGVPACEAFLEDAGGGLDPKRFTALVLGARGTGSVGPRGAARTLRRQVLKALRAKARAPRPAR